MTTTQDPLHNTPKVEPTTALNRATSVDDRRFSIWAGWCGLAASLAYLTTVVASSLLGSVETYDGPDDIVRYLQDVSDNAARSWLYGIAGIIMALLYLPFGLAAYQKLHRTAAAGLGSVAMITGLVALIPAYTISILEIASLAPTATELGQDGSRALYTVTEAAAGVQVVAFTVGSILTLGIAPLLWAIAARRTKALAGWLSSAGIVVGTTGAVWFVWFLETPAVLGVLLINVVASLVFFIGLAKALLNSSGNPGEPTRRMMNEQ